MSKMGIQHATYYRTSCHDQCIADCAPWFIPFGHASLVNSYFGALVDLCTVLICFLVAVVTVSGCCNNRFGARTRLLYVLVFLVIYYTRWCAMYFTCGFTFTLYCSLNYSIVIALDVWTLYEYISTMWFCVNKNVKLRQIISSIQMFELLFFTAVNTVHTVGLQLRGFLYQNLATVMPSWALHCNRKPILQEKWRMRTNPTHKNILHYAVR